MKNKTKASFINGIWICGLVHNKNNKLVEIIGRTVLIDDIEIVSYVDEDGFIWMCKFEDVLNIFKIEPNFQKERILVQKEENALKDLLTEFNITFNKN